MQMQPGNLVNDRLRLVRLLGRGGMGSVWIAHHEALDIEVAVKFIAPELAFEGDPLVLARFRREAQLAAKLDGPNIVRVLDHGVTSEGVPYIVMELLRGETLGERFAAQRTLPPKDVARIMNDVAEGLAQAHELGIVHRDIKPQNLFLTKNRSGREIVKVLDFGIARSDAPGGSVATASGSLIGTPLYMSPEQLLEARAADKSSDLWALSVVAYEALTGRHPFGGETTALVMMAITRGAFARASNGTGLPPPVDAFFERAFALDRAARFGSAPELARAFTESISGAADTAVEPRPKSSDVSDTSETSAFARSRGLDIVTSPPLPLDDTQLALPPKVNAISASASKPELVRNVPGPTKASRPWRTAAAIAGAIGCAAIATWWIATTLAAPPGTAKTATAVTPDTQAGTVAPSSSARSEVNVIPTVVTESFFECPDTVLTHCAIPAKAWCDADDRAIGCCAPGLAAVGPNECACAPGGSKDKDAVAAGCPEAKPYDIPSVQKEIRTHSGPMRECYEAALSKNAKLRGTLSFRFDIGPTGLPGHVGFANAGAPDPAFQDCVIRVFSTLRFLPPPDGSIAITYPIVFSPGG